MACQSLASTFHHIQHNETDHKVRRRNQEQEEGGGLPVESPALTCAPPCSHLSHYSPSLYESTSPSTEMHASQDVENHPPTKHMEAKRQMH